MLFFQLLFDCKKHFEYMKNFWLTCGGRFLLLVWIGSEEETQQKFFTVNSSMFLNIIFQCVAA